MTMPELSRPWTVRRPCTSTMYVDHVRRPVHRPRTRPSMRRCYDYAPSTSTHALPLPCACGRIACIHQPWMNTVTADVPGRLC